MIADTKEVEKDVVERFCRYVQVETTSDPDSTTCPSSAKIFDLARILERELRELGVSDVRLDEEHCVVYGTLKGNAGEQRAGAARGIGVAAHMDTSPDVSGKGVKPMIHTVERAAHAAAGLRLACGDVAIEWADLARFEGQRIITSDGTTLLGADDKSGVAIVMSAVAYLQAHPEVRRPDVYVVFNPDEEIGRGTEGVDVGWLRERVECMYTVDGGDVGSVETETFNAYAAELRVEGVCKHPGYGYQAMANAAQIAADFCARLPADRRPETTRGREGYIALCSLEGGFESAKASFILRAFDMADIAQFRATMDGVAAQLRAENPLARVALEYTFQYTNMKAKLKQEAVDAAIDAYKRAGITPVVESVRGGTDGAALTEEGVSCPNLFSGAVNFHSRREFVPIPTMVKGVEAVVALAEVWAERIYGQKQ